MEQFTHETFLLHITPNEGFEHGYTLTDITECVMRDGVAWIGTIRLNDVAVGSVECHGDGGCYSYHFDEVSQRILFDQAVSDAYYMRDMVDVERDCFINFMDAKVSA